MFVTVYTLHDVNTAGEASGVTELVATSTSWSTMNNKVMRIFIVILHPSSSFISYCVSL